MARSRNGIIDDLNKLHWFWKLLIITGTFGVVQALIAGGNPYSRNRRHEGDRPRELPL